MRTNRKLQFWLLVCVVHSALTTKGPGFTNDSWVTPGPDLHPAFLGRRVGWVLWELHIPENGPDKMQESPRELMSLGTEPVTSFLLPSLILHLPKNLFQAIADDGSSTAPAVC